MEYAILNHENICETIVSYNQPLETPPENYISIQNGQDVRWRKYTGGQWSEEKFEPAPVVPTPTLEEQIESLKQDNLILMDVLATMYEDMLAKGTV